MLGLRREALRKFIHGRTANPRESTRRLIGEAYLVLHPGGLGEVREVRSEVPLPTPEEFRLIFKDREDAHRKFAELFARVPPTADGTPPTWATVTQILMNRLADVAFARGLATYGARAGADDGDGAQGGTAKKPAAVKNGGGAAKGSGEGAKKRPPVRPRKKRDDAGGGEEAE